MIEASGDSWDVRQEEKETEMRNGIGNEGKGKK